MTSPRLQRYHRKIIETYRYEGLPFLMWRIFTWCIAPLGSVYLVWLCKKELREPLEDLEAKIPVEVVQATEADLEAIAAMVAKRLSTTQTGSGWYRQLGIRGTIVERFQRGDKCFLGKVGQEVVHFSWIFFDRAEPISITGRCIHLNADEAMCNDGFTEEAWRGKSVARTVNYQMLRFLKMSGYRTALISVGADNLVSQKILRRIGWEFSSLIVCIIPRSSSKEWTWQFDGFLKKTVDLLSSFRQPWHPVVKKSVTRRTL
jgi:hypothetical protein